MWKGWGRELNGKLEWEIVNQSGQNAGEKRYIKTRLSKSLSEIMECVGLQSLGLF